MRLGRGRGVRNFLSSISIVGKITFGVTFVVVFYFNLGFYYPGFLFIFPLGVAFIVTFIVEVIYSMFRNKSNLP